MKKRNLLYATGVCALALGALAPIAPAAVSFTGQAVEVRAADGSNTLTIHKYEEPTTPTGLPHDGHQVDESTIGTKPLQNISFKVTAVTLKDGKKWTDAVNSTTHVIDETAFTRGTSKVLATDAKGAAAFTDLPDAVYLVEELPNSTVEKPAVPFLVQLPLLNDTAEDGGVPNSDVHVYPKNTTGKDDFTGKISKKLQDGTAGDVNDKEVGWNLNSFVPASAYQAADATTGAVETYAKDFSLIDPLDVRLAYVADSATGGYSDLQGGALTDFTAADFVVTTDDLTSTTGGQVVHIKLTESGMKKAAGKYVTFKIKTTIKDYGEIVDGLYKPIVNSFSTHYDPNGSNPLDPTDPIDPTDPTDPTTPTDPTDPETPKVELGRIDILKTEDDQAATALKGAEFKLVKHTGSNTLAQDKEANGGFVKGSLDANNNMVAGTGDLVVTSADDGKLFVNGLELNAEYWLVEVKAPTGFSQVEPFILKATYDTTQDKVVADPTDWVNKYIPLTGGQLRITLMVVGTVLIIGTGTAIYIKKRREQAAQ